MAIDPYRDYAEVNRNSWNQRTDYHLKSEFYDLDGFLKGNTSLNEIELALLGDLKGKSVLHLQCHFGQDSLSLARMGAKVMGVDISDRAIQAAEDLNRQLGLDAEFLCCNVYDLPDMTDKKFDFVFTTYGVIGWLPDLDRWAGLIDHCLKSGGRLLLVEFHPAVWMFDDDFTHIKYKYSKSDPIVELSEGTYADNDAQIDGSFVMWNHGLGEVFGSLTSKGLTVDHLKEYDYSPYDCFSHTEKIGERQYRIKHLGDKIPMVYSLSATKS